MKADSYRKRPVGWIAGAALAAMVLGVTGCSSDSDSGEKKPAADSSSADRPTEGKKDDSSTPPPSNTRQSSAEGAVAAWVTAIVKGQPKKACLVMAEPASGSSPAQVGSPSRCDSDDPKVRKMRENLGRFRASFSPKPPPSDPQVEVAKTPATGGKAVVPADKVTIDGKPLDKVILSNSSGVKAGQLDVKMTSSKIDDAWYVTDFALDLG
ncbi:hypothetical protein [Streptomyces reniochalinae]|uniref:DUF4333 domain-containing protein n=1 Tax=Streptomyces reniochalinae TaxID=2250578 RepID=A0A367EJI8_9ACTN|nr:hypothetical protein [Streptomyces reniochalinae]RCG17537.1 hypothetical protein DQ392_16860 [Streptomyces reniochalinae]